MLDSLYLLGALSVDNSCGCAVLIDLAGGVAGGGNVDKVDSEGGCHDSTIWQVDSFVFVM